MSNEEVLEKKSGDARLHLSLLSQFQPQTGTWFILSENKKVIALSAATLCPWAWGPFLLLITNVDNWSENKNKCLIINVINQQSLFNTSAHPIFQLATVSICS